MSGGPARGGFHLLPPGAPQRLNLSEDQLKQLAALEAKTKAELAQILTPDQMKQLEQMRPQRREGGPGGPGSPGGRGGPEGQGGPGGPGGPDGQGGPPPPQ